MKRILGTAALALALTATAAHAQEDGATASWSEIRDFIERNPGIRDQLVTMMEREIKPEQAARDAAFISENPDLHQDPAAPVLGNPNGEVLVVKFSDFRCSHCRNVTPELEKLVASDPRVKLVIREFPILGPQSIEAARFALAANRIGGSEAYKTVQHMLFAADWSDDMTLGAYKDIADAAGLDFAEISGMMDDPDINAHLDRTFQLAENLKITGTPAIIIGDVVARGSIPFDTMQVGVAEIYAE